MIRLLALLLALLGGCAHKPKGLDVPTEKAKREDFVVSIDERCELEAENARKILCPRFARRWMSMKITKLVPEGAKVKKGDLLLSLDKTDLNRMERDLKADVRRAKAEAARLEKALAIEKQRLEAELERRAADMRIKELDLIYLQHLPTTVAATKAKTQLQKAKLQAAFARDEFEPFKALLKIGVQSQAQFSEKKLAADIAEIEREAEKLEYDRTMAGAEALDMTKAKLAMRDAKLRYDLAKTELDLKAKQAQCSVDEAQWELKRQELELKRFQESIKLADFYSPKAGIVVYQKVFQGSAMEKIKEGVTVRPYQHLMSIEDTSSMVAKVQVEEAQSAMLALKQKAEIALDAVPDSKFTGKVIEIGTIAHEKGEKNSGQWWKGKSDKEDTGIRVFDVKVRLDGSDDRLRSGMAGKIKIITETIPDAICVPMEAVFKTRDRGSYVYLVNQAHPVEHPVKTGKAAAGRIVVTEGLAQGDEVCLAQPGATP